jgi:hypothetical protein
LAPATACSLTSMRPSCSLISGRVILL